MCECGVYTICILAISFHRIINNFRFYFSPARPKNNTIFYYYCIATLHRVKRHYLNTSMLRFNNNIYIGI